MSALDTSPSAGLRLVAPTAWIVDPLVQARLARRLARLPADVAGVVAPGGPLRAGSSYRVHAEWLALDPAGPDELTDAPVPGVALLRAGVDAELDDAGVRVPGRPLLVDRGAHAHDPWAPPGPIEAADPRGRSPFPRRPLVLFLQAGPDDELESADWSRTIVNGLVRHEVEARMARRATSPGLHLTRACLPTEASVSALRPDVIVTLDDESLELATRWCAPLRSTIFVDFSLDSTVGIELVPWRLGSSIGRVRARVGQAVDAASFARLVSRLCAGPQPVPPDKGAVNINVTPLPVPARKPAPARPPSITLVRTDPHVRDDRIDPFLEHAALLGATTAVRGADDDRPLDEDTIVVVESAMEPSRLAALVDERARDGRRTVVDVGDRGHDAETAAVVERGGFAVAASAATVRAYASTGARIQLLPTLFTRERLVELARARLTEPVEGRSLALCLDDDALAAAVTDHVRATHRDVVVHRLAAGDPVPPDAMGLVWRDRRAAKGRPGTVLEAGLLGVPSVFPADAADAVTDPIVARLAVHADADTAAWGRAVDDLLDSATADERFRVARRARALYGPKATTALVRRILSWVTHETGT